MLNVKELQLCELPDDITLTLTMFHAHTSSDDYMEVCIIFMIISKQDTARHLRQL